MSIRNERKREIKTNTYDFGFSNWLAEMEKTEPGVGF